MDNLDKLENSFTVKEVALKLGYAVGYVYNLVSNGKLKSFKCGGLVRIKRETLNDWIRIDED